ncbi:MAG TPA: DNA mismatch repair endonuclease MutL [Patescibacteria group bacterium]|nr:DNA mismatch repair endonuclease MutL [Patescibacteria group bacterium]
MVESMIRVLDENTANKIAAGEVVERPAAVVKELVENALDAGAQTIEVEIAEGGIGFIRVRDDGGGMSRPDAELAVLRHATSKIRSAEDLSHISSLGFRGEALPSIAAVSKFVLTTRLAEEALGTYLEIQGGTVTDLREAGAGPGTTVAVTDLFYNTPARRKFLKSAGAEGSHINDIVSKLSLAYPHVAFRLLNNGRLVLSTAGNGRLADAMASLYGNKILPDILPIDYSGENLSVTGYVAKPSLLKSNRHWQTFMVNSRIVNSRMLYKALDSAYHSLLPKAGYPLAVVCLLLPTETIDVNVHPQKNEVKFSDEQQVYRAVYRAVSQALTAVDDFAAPVPERYYQIPADAPRSAAVYETPAVAAVPLWNTSPARENAGPVNQDTPSPTVYTPFKAARPSVPSFSPAAVNREADTIPAEPGGHTEPVLNPQKINSPETSAETLRVSQNPEGESKVVVSPQDEQAEETPPMADQPAGAERMEALGQVDSCYIIARGTDGLYIIDQHAAHERILYDRMSRAAERIPAQQLLIPRYLDVDDGEYQLMEEYKDEFQKLGFSLEPIGPSSMRLMEMPADIAEKDAEDLLRQILAWLRNRTDNAPQALRHAALQMAACRSAIKAGETLNPQQIRLLLEELFRTDYPYTCPHGRPTTIRFSAGDLARMFKRT